MSDADDLAKSWIASIRKHRPIALVIVIGTVLAGLSTTFTNANKLFEFFDLWTARPRVLALNLSDKSVGYTDTQDVLFGSSEKLYRTFQAPPPWDIPPAAVFTVTISNPTKKDVIISSSVYNVREVGAIKSGGAGPLQPLASYSHSIEHKTGLQDRRLAPPFRVPADSAASFDIQIMPESFEKGLGWLLKIGFSDGNIRFYTEEFQLYLAKSEQKSPKEKLSERLTADEVISRYGADFSDAIMERKVLVKSSEIDLYYVNCLLRKVHFRPTSLTEYDRILMFMLAGALRQSDFFEQETSVKPAKKYGELMDRISALTFILLVKSQADCQ